MMTVHDLIPHPTLRLVCIASLFAAQPVLAGPVDTAPAATVMPGTVSMSASASFNTMGALSKELSPEDMRQVNDYLRESVLATVTNRPIVMNPELAQKIAQVRERMRTTQPEGAKSIDLMFGQPLEEALRK